MAISGNDESLGGAHASACGDCGSALAPDQRYCLRCGARRGPLPAAVAKWLSIVPAAVEQAEVPSGDPAAAGAGALAAPVVADDDSSPLDRYMPEPRAAAIAVMALLAFGVFLGGLTGPVAQSAGISPIVVDLGQPVAESSPPPEPVPVASTPEPVPAPPAALPEAAPESVPVAPEAPPATAPKHTVAQEVPAAPTLPPVEHVFLIVLADHGYEEAYGASSTAPYLAKTLAAKGELLSNYYAVTEGDLANEIALVSGQGPNPATAANCPEYKDFVPGRLDAKGQVEGEGCVYPAEVQALPAQLATVKKSWKAYIEGNGEAAQPLSCRHPLPGALDEMQAPRPGDAYETWRNPFVYFHSIADSPECAERDVGLEQLGLDLKKEGSTPSFSYIVPNACHDGDEKPCEEGQPAGLAAAQPFLETVVPEIEASPAYKKGGLIAITSAQAPQTVPEPDTSACCATPEYPNLPPPTTPPPPATGPIKETGGGGRVGMLLLSPFVEPGSVNESGYYNHFSFLLSVGELLGFTTPLGYAAEPALTAFDSTVFNLSKTSALGKSAQGRKAS